MIVRNNLLLRAPAFITCLTTSSCIQRFATKPTPWTGQPILRSAPEIRQKQSRSVSSSAMVRVFHRPTCSNHVKFSQPPLRRSLLLGISIDVSLTKLFNLASSLAPTIPFEHDHFSYWPHSILCATCLPHGFQHYLGSTHGQFQACQGQF